MLERVLPMLRKEFIQVLRDPRTRVVIFITPIIQTLIFGYAVTTDVRHTPTAVLDYDGSAASRDLAARFANSGRFDVVARLDDDDAMADVLDRGRATAILRVDHGFEADLLAGRPARVQLVLDGTDSNTAGIVMAYAARIARAYSRDVLLERVRRSRGGLEVAEGVELVERAWFNEDLESRNYFVPGVIAMIVMLVTLLLTSMAVVREREIGTMEQVMVTPITPAEFILGKTLPFALVALADLTIITLVGVLWFEVPIRGSIPLLFLATLLYLATTLGIGLLISTVSGTQQEALLGTFFFYLPTVLLSGFMFPIANMPEPVQWITVVNPLRYYLVVIRGIFLKGVGAEILAPQLAALAVMGAATMTLAARRFRKTFA